MNGPQTRRHEALDVAVDAAGTDAGVGDDPSQWEARHRLDRHRAETDRLRVLVEFLARPLQAPGGAEPDPDILTAYNLAIEAALNGVRRAALNVLDLKTED